MKTMRTYLNNNPWIYVVLAFVVLITAWSTLITIAVKHSPQKIEITK